MTCSFFVNYVHILFSNFSYLLCIANIIIPKRKDITISIKFKIPSVENDIFIIIVEIINPEFLIILLKLSECKKENKSKKTSTKIRMNRL